MTDMPSSCAAVSGEQTCHRLKRSSRHCRGCLVGGRARETAAEESMQMCSPLRGSRMLSMRGCSCRWTGPAGDCSGQIGDGRLMLGKGHVQR